MEALRTKILICRLCQKIAIARLNGVYTKSDVDNCHKIVQDELAEYLLYFNISTIEYILGRTESEIVTGIQKGDPEAVNFDNAQLIIPSNV